MEKNIYIIPCTTIVKVLTEHLVAESIQRGEGTFDSSSMKYVKENPAGRSDYNVWNDDWSN